MHNDLFSDIIIIILLFYCIIFVIVDCNDSSNFKAKCEYRGGVVLKNECLKVEKIPLN